MLYYTHSHDMSKLYDITMLFKDFTNGSLLNDLALALSPKSDSPEIWPSNALCMPFFAC